MEKLLLTNLDIERFKTKFIKDTPPKCWNWIAGLSTQRYGKFSIKHKCYGAHRVAYSIYYRINPLKKYVCHRCDNPKCVNPKHLFLGTAQDNKNDCVKKKRHAFGDNHWTILHPERITFRGNNHWTRKFPEKVLRGNKHFLHNHPEFAARGIYSGRYTHPERNARGEKNGSAKLTPKEVIEIRKQYSSNKFTVRKLAKIHRVSKSLISAIIMKHIWKHI